MKSFTKRLIALLVLLVSTAAVGEFASSAQVPSIPRRSTVKRSTQRSSNVVWGTQYDWLSNRYVTYDDIRYMDRGQVRVLKNSIYARHGYVFNDSNLRAYFNSQRWYRGYRKSIPTKEFSKIEQYNIQFLRSYE
ncbi:MAG: YARHG domain-containing protein [Bacteroidales bacterium]|nr:YARHG domain-containing protein [Bacteroidales bacterium]